MDELWVVTGSKEVYYPRVSDFHFEDLNGISELSFKWKNKDGIIADRKLVGNFSWKLSAGSYVEPPPTTGKVVTLPHPQHPPTRAVAV